MAKQKSKSQPKTTKKPWQKLIKHKTVDGKKHKLYLLETNTHLRSFVEYRQVGDLPIGAMLLNTGTINDPAYRVRFILKCSGIHDYQDAIQAESAISGIAALIREVPQGENLRVCWQCFPDPIDRELELSQTFRSTYDRPEFQSEPALQMIVEEIKILRDAHQNGHRRQQELFLAVTYTAKSEQLEKDGLESAIEFFSSLPNKFLGKVSGADKILAEENLDRFLLKAYQSGYLYWTTLIRERLQMAFTPLDAEGIWQFCRAETNRFHDRQTRIQAIQSGRELQTPAMPHLITYDLTNNEITEFADSRLHPTSLIHEELSSIPATGRDYVFVDGKYVGCMYLKSQPNSFDASGRRTLDLVQLQYLWDILSKRDCYDVRVLLEMSVVDRVAVNINNQDLIQQASQQINAAQSKGKVDVRAQMNLEEAVQSQRDITAGDPTLDFGLSVYFYRDTLADLRAVMSAFRQCFRSPATMLSDIDTCDALWLQSLPYYGRSLLVDTRDRRDRTTAQVLASYLPLLLPQSPHSKGIEFIANKGGTPIYFDAFDPQHQGHIALWGKTRSGKTLLAAWKIYRALIEGVKTTIVDQPPSGEASSFKDFVTNMNGGYVDILTDCLNPFELPNLPATATQGQRDDLRQESQIHLLRVLKAMVLGDIQDSTPHTKRVEGFLPVILQKFLENNLIKLRYIRAREGGCGSPAWAEHPILEDYVQFCEVSHVGLTDATLEDLETMGFIRNQLRKWTSGQHARVLNSPSTVEIDKVPLLAIAMRGVTGNDEAAVFGSLIYLVAMRRAIAASASPRGSFLFVDEAARTIPIRAIGDAIAATMVNGLKAGMRVMLASQEPGSIANSANGEQIMDALTYQFIGRIGSDSIDAYKKYIHLPYELAVLNAGIDFAPDKATNSSRWLIKFNDRFTAVTAYLPPSLVALTANNVDERLERQERQTIASLQT
jgi:hypothetical protein